MKRRIITLAITTAMFLVAAAAALAQSGSFKFKKPVNIELMGIAETPSHDGLRFVATDGRSSYAQVTHSEGPAHFIADELADALIQEHEGGFRTVVVIPKTTLRVVWIWPSEARPAEQEYTVLSPFKMGERWKSSDLSPYAWKHSWYPGPSFAPLLLVELEPDRTRLLHASDHPPRNVEMMHAAGMETMIWRGEFQPGLPAIFEYRDTIIFGDWQQAATEYRNWLAPKLKASGVVADHPKWLKKSHGYLNVQLQNLTEYKGPESFRWRTGPYEDILPWYNFWGQMSNYAGPPELAKPPLEPGEETGCCLMTDRQHPRYLPGLAKWAAEYQNQGSKRVSFYTRPRGEGDMRLNEQRNNLKAGLNANAFYVDVVGMVDFGPRFQIANQLRRMSRNLFIEGADAYLPFPTMISGCYNTRVEPAPEFGRMILDDRLIFLGESNNGHTRWGAENGYEQEIAAFLLGAKFDTIRPNPVVRQICELRDRTDWWDRSPQYRHTLGVKPEGGVERRRFVDERGRILDVCVTRTGGEPKLWIEERD